MLFCLRDIVNAREELNAYLREQISYRLLLEHEQGAL